jgi:hypothetical protein
MATAGNANLANQARRRYVDDLVEGLPLAARNIGNVARGLSDKPSEGGLSSQRRRELAQDWQRCEAGWLQALTTALLNTLLYGSPGVPGKSGATTAQGGGAFDKLTLVDDDTIEREILSSRMALAVMDRASWEFTDLRARITKLERKAELEPHDLLRAHVLARLAVDAWCEAGLGLASWRDLQHALHHEVGALVEEAYHEANDMLLAQGVMPEVDLRPLVRRSRDAGNRSVQGSLDAYVSSTSTLRRGGGDGAGVHDETRLMTRAQQLAQAQSAQHAGAVLDRLNRLVARQLPGFADTTRQAARPASPGLAAAIGVAEQGVRQRFAATAGAPVTAPAVLQELQQRKAALKEAAASPIERATIEIVALLFQSILTEDRLPAAVRVWFARLQMPVLRVAVGEPDFFATVEHPARRLIDRMGACVMGFDASTREVGDALEKEIKRVVQVVEAYPDTGRRVFQTVLTEFERFLEHYFKSENEVSKKGVSLAQQIEQRETLAIQYTIELRKMLNEVPVQEGVRNFLFQVWADVLAITALKHSPGSEQTKAMKRAASDLIWSAGAKVSREERAEVIRRLPPLLKTLRDGMGSAGLSEEAQDEHIGALNNALAAAFSAKAQAIPQDRFDEMRERLERIEQLLPDSADLEVDEAAMLDLSGHESSELEVVTEGGSMPTPAMLAWARELQVGTWYMLDYRNRSEPVQLVWQGMKRQLTLFVAAGGRCVLFQQQRLAAFLQAGLLLPAQDEALTVRATRDALAKLDADPARLMN